MRQSKSVWLHSLLSPPPAGLETFKAQLFALTSVPIERQKILAKGGKQVKEDADLAKLKTVHAAAAASLLRENICKKSADHFDCRFFVSR